MRHPDGVRLLDDRSLNGVFVNGARIDGRALQDGDEIIVGRYRLSFLRVAAEATAAAGSDAGPVASSELKRPLSAAPGAGPERRLTIS